MPVSSRTDPSVPQVLPEETMAKAMREGSLVIQMFEHFSASTQAIVPRWRDYVTKHGRGRLRAGMRFVAPTGNEFAHARAVLARLSGKDPYSREVEAALRDMQRTFGVKFLIYTDTHVGAG